MSCVVSAFLLDELLSLACGIFVHAYGTVPSVDCVASIAIRQGEDHMVRMCVGRFLLLISSSG